MVIHLAAFEMGMKTYLGIASAGLAVAVIGLLVRKQFGAGAVIPGWLAGSISGAFLGLGVGFVFMHQLGYRWLEQPPVIQVAPNIVMGGVTTGQGGPPGGGPGGGGPGGGGNRPSVTPASVVSFVKKLNLLASGLKVELSAEQAGKMNDVLKDIESDESMPNEEAEQRLDALMAVLTEEQKTTLASFDIPRRRGQGGGGPGGGGGGGGGPGGGMGGPPGGMGGPPGGMGAGGGGAGGRGAPQEPPKNPFKNDDEGSSLEQLRARLKVAN